MYPTQNGRSAPGARKGAIFGNSIPSLMLVLLTTSHPTWLPVALAEPVPGGAEYTTNKQLLPPVAMDSMSNFVIVWESFASAGTDTGKNNIGVQGPLLRQHGDGDENNPAEPAVAMDSADNFVVVWLSDGEPRIGHPSITVLRYTADTSPGREIEETSAQPPHAEEFAKPDQDETRSNQEHLSLQKDADQRPTAFSPGTGRFGVGW